MRRQIKDKIHYLDPIGSYSFNAAKKIIEINNDFELIPCGSFSSIVKKVLDDKSNFGIIPIKNSSTSSIYENLEYILSAQFWISYEINLPINLSLIGLRDSSSTSIEEVYSHHKALEQSSFLSLKII